MTQPAPPIGSMQLFDAVVPAMSSGAHRLTTIVDLDAPGATPGPTRAVHRDFVTVGGSALHFQPTEVLSMHPPRNATGGFDDALPHVVLRRRTLPWERTGPNGVPWLVLLVFLDSEVSFSSGALSAVLPTLAAQFGADAAPPDTPTDVVHVTDPAVLAAVLPTPAEVPLLSHVRRVNTADTTLDMNDDDGWLAVVVANRLPVRPADGPGHYHACLVSLEHRDDLYKSPPASTSLILLYRWEFITDTDGTFATLARTLDVGTLGQPGDTAAADGDGRIELALTARDGSSSTGLYRGPFTVSASAAPASDDVDVSYDAAYELGRLLAAADGPLTRELVDWHRASTTAAQVSVQHADLRARTAATVPALDEHALDEHGTHVQAAAAGLSSLVRSLAPAAPHRRVVAGGGTDA